MPILLKFLKRISYLFVPDETIPSAGPKEERDDLVNPYWMEDKSLKRGEVDFMPGAEVNFFKDLIEKYLHPLVKNSMEQVYNPQIQSRRKRVFGCQLVLLRFLRLPPTKQSGKLKIL